MRRALIDGIELEYDVHGAGEPVLLIHAGVWADWFVALMDEPALAGYRLIHYHRMGYAGSGRSDGPVSVEQQAAHCREILRHVGVDRAHVVGHSSGATIALQLALDHPRAVHTLALLETALLAVPSGPFAPAAMERYRAGDPAGAVDTWMRGVGGDTYRALWERVRVAAFEQAVADADTFFGAELPAVREWVFGPGEAARIMQPALVVLGADSDRISPSFGQRHELLLDWLPAAEPFVLPAATHLLHLANPAGMAHGLARFFARNPLID